MQRLSVSWTVVEGIVDDLARQRVEVRDWQGFVRECEVMAGVDVDVLLERETPTEASGLDVAVFRKPAELGRLLQWVAEHAALGAGDQVLTDHAGMDA